MSHKLVKHISFRALVTAVMLCVAVRAYAIADGLGNVRAEGAGLSSICTPEAMSSVVATLAGGVTIKQVPNGPQLPGGVKLTPAKGKLSAYCQVTGSYVTNPKTGKTANFIATFPEKWNGKYLQLGCSGPCGYLMMNDPAEGPIAITAQGYPGQLIEKGYATFGNDLGHIAPSPAAASWDWLKAKDGGADEDVLLDFLYRADQVMVDTAKAFTRAVYAYQIGKQPEITKSYFLGCSQGGREALVAATHFPEKFDGIVAGSPASDMPGVVWAGMAHGMVLQQPGLSKLTDGQIATLKQVIFDKCDAVDGVKDGLIQNPAACAFNPYRDLTICKDGQANDSCVTKQQAEAISSLLSGATDEKGRVLQPGYAVDEPNANWINLVPASMSLDSDQHFFVGKEFDGRQLASSKMGENGTIDSFHSILNGAAYQKYLNMMREGTVLPEDFAKFLKSSGKLLWYHNLSDEMLTPYMSINRYKRVAELNGGYAKVQEKIRFFGIAGTNHCGLSGNAPTNFDAIGTLESWVEDNVAPDAIPARQNDPATANPIMGLIDWSRPPVRTIPLCMFPEMAHYKGTGDVKDASNWECQSSDSRMLKVGISGREAGVVE